LFALLYLFVRVIVRSIYWIENLSIIHDYFAVDIKLNVIFNTSGRRLVRHPMDVYMVSLL
jgi:hypothetical protein